MFPSLEAWDVRDDACEVGDKTKWESIDGAESAEVDDRSLLPKVLFFAPLLGTAGLTKASPTTGRGLEDLAAKVLLAPVGLDIGFEMIFALPDCRIVLLVGREGFDGVVSRIPLVFWLVWGRLFGTYELTARLFGVVFVDKVPLGRLIGEVARGAIEGIGGIGGRWL